MTAFFDPITSRDKSGIAAWRRRFVSVIRWTLTFQLHIQFGYWLRARRQRSRPMANILPALIRTADPAAIVLPREIRTPASQAG